MSEIHVPGASDLYAMVHGTEPNLPLAQQAVNLQLTVMQRAIERGDAEAAQTAEFTLNALFSAVPGLRNQGEVED